jgi:hypothetical protein
LIFIAYFNVNEASDIIRIIGHSLLAISPELLEEHRVKTVALAGGKRRENEVAGCFVVGIWICQFASTAKKWYRLILKSTCVWQPFLDRLKGIAWKEKCVELTEQYQIRWRCDSRG